MLRIKLGENFEVKLGVWSKTGSKNYSAMAFLNCMDRSVLAFLKCMNGSVLVSLKYMDVSVLAHLRFPIQSAPTRLPQSRNSVVPQLLCKKSSKMSYLKYNVWSIVLQTDHIGLWWSKLDAQIHWQIITFLQRPTSYINSKHYTRLCILCNA